MRPVGREPELAPLEAFLAGEGRALVLTGGPGIGKTTLPVAADLVGALVEFGEQDEAQAVTVRVTALAETQDHPWGRATAARCAALLSPGEDDAAANKEIARALFVSVRTVEAHLSHAYAKLGIHSRRQLAARL